MMSTPYTHRATIAAPLAKIPDANQLALCLGESRADNRTFTSASYQDADGNLYAVASAVARPSFAAAASQKLEAPSHSLDIDIAAATQAQSLLQINSGIASPGVIAVILGDRIESAQDHIKTLGLTRVEQKPEL